MALPPGGVALARDDRQLSASSLSERRLRTARTSFQEPHRPLGRRTPEPRRLAHPRAHRVVHHRGATCRRISRAHRASAQHLVHHATASRSGFRAAQVSKKEQAKNLGCAPSADDEARACGALCRHQGRTVLRARSLRAIWRDTQNESQERGAGRRNLDAAEAVKLETGKARYEKLPILPRQSLAKRSAKTW